MSSIRHSARAPRRLGRRLLAVPLLLAAAVALPSGALPAPTVAAADSLGAGGEYHPLTPARIYDSRPGLPGSEEGAGAKPITPGGSEFSIPLLGRGGLPASGTDVLAVVVNIVVADPTSQGWLNAYGTGAPAGLAAIVNFRANQTVPNLAIVRPGQDGRLTIKLAAGTGTANVVVDVFGWFSTSAAQPATSGARLVPVSPGRILDTRSGLNRSPAGPLNERETIEVPVRGVDAAEPAVVDIVPNDPKVVGVVLNMAGVNDLPTSAATHLSVVPDPLPAGQSPSTANLNLVKGQVKSNMVMVPIGADGKIRVYNNSATAHVVLDVVGYLIAQQDPTTRTGRVVPLSAPYRVFDTREAQWLGTPLGAGQAEDWSFSDFAGSVTIGGVSVGNQMGVIGNLTSASLERQYPNVPVGSFLTVYPGGPGAQRPTAANLNMVEGQITQNMVVMKYGPNATAQVYNYAGKVHYVYDASAVVLAD